MEREESEGDNLEHAVEKDSTRAVFKTMGGRVVYGGGGITPDYIVKSDSLNAYTIQLWSKQVWLQYADKYADEHKDELKARYGKENAKFVEEFSVKEDMLKDLVALANSKNIEFKQDLYEKDKRFIKAYSKAFLARRVWGNEGWSRVMLAEDAQFKKAVSLFPEAERISKNLSSLK